jgi:hypothetical protein
MISQTEKAKTVESKVKSNPFLKTKKQRLSKLMT